MSIKGKIMNTITSHPRLVTFGIALATTVVASIAVSVIGIANAARQDFCCDQ